jgi:hypothetical protein
LQQTNLNLDFIEENLYSLEFDSEQMLEIQTKTDPKELANKSKQLNGFVRSFVRSFVRRRRNPNS